MGFVAMLLSVVGLTHAYLWKRLVRDTTGPGRGRRWGTAGILAMFALVVSALLTRYAPVDVARWFAWPGFMALAVMLYLAVILLALEIPRLVVLLGLRFGDRRTRPATGSEPSVQGGSAPAAGASSTLASAAPEAAAEQSVAEQSVAPASVRTDGGESVSTGHPSAPGDGGTLVTGTPPDYGAAATDQDARAPAVGTGGTDQDAGAPAVGTGGTDQDAGAPAVGTGGTDQDARAPAVGTGGTDQDAAAPAGGAGGLGSAGERRSATYLDRRRFLSRGLAAAAGVAAVGTVGYGTYTALAPPQARRVPITLPRLDPAFDGFRVAVVSDIHLGPLRGRAHTERIVRTINGMRPDMIAVVGDLVDGTVPELGAAAAPLRDLEAEHGAYFVTGNHEYYAGADAWLEEIRGLGLRPLLNERTEITRGNAAFDLAGVNDVTAEEFGGGPDFARTLAGRDPARAVVLLAHQPVLAPEAAEHDVDLQLSGHTHGGQLWPFHYVVRAAQGTVAGRATIDGTELYVTRGVGFWGPPVRVGAPPEVTLIQLDSAA